MSYFADYRKAVRTAAEVLEDWDSRVIPLRLDLLISRFSNEIRLYSYTRLSAKFGLSLTQAADMLDSDLGACAWDPQSGRFLIYYNDTRPAAVCRFTVAHELGHIFLRHHETAGSSVLSRSFVPKAQYAEFEKEANAFARNLLCPAVLADAVNRKNHGAAVGPISKVFFISNTAARVRLFFLKQDLFCLPTEKAAFFSGFHAVRPSPVCGGCGTALPAGMRFCPLCGSSAVRPGYAYSPLPAEEPEMSPASACPRCGNARFLPGAEFCHLCGTGRRNLCRSGHPNPSFARFCSVCGAPVRNRDLLSLPALDPADPEFSFRLPALRESGSSFLYDGADGSEPGQKAWTCVLCGTDNRADRSDCRVCMCPRQNGCPCCGKESDRNARFCRFCGAPTLYRNAGVFSPTRRKQEAKSARETIRLYKKYGHYYQWEDGPFQGPAEMYE